MNENKNILPIIVVVVLVLGLGFLMYRGQSPKATELTPNDAVTQTETTKKEMAVAKPYMLKDGNYTFNPAVSELMWSAKKTLIATWVDSGTVMLKEGSVMVDGGKVTSGKIVVDMASLAAKVTGKGDGQDSLTKHLKSADFFDVEKFPTSEFMLKTVESVGEGKYKADGDLTIKGMTKPLSTQLMAEEMADGSVVLSGKLMIDRTQYDVKFGSTKFFESLGDKAIDDIFEVDLKLVGAMVK